MGNDPLDFRRNRRCHRWQRFGRLRGHRHRVRQPRGRPRRPVRRDEGRGHRRPSLPRPSLCAGCRGGDRIGGHRPPAHPGGGRLRRVAGARPCQPRAHDREDRRRHRIGRQDLRQGSPVRRARPVDARPRPPLGQKLQQPYRRPAQPGPDAARRGDRRVRDGHEPCRRTRRADPDCSARRRDRHRHRPRAHRILPGRKRDRRCQGGDLPGPAPRRHRDHPLRQPAPRPVSSPPPSPTPRGS